MDAKHVPKIIAIVPIAALFAFARIELANAYYEHVTVGGDQAAVSTGSHAQVSSTVTSSPLLQDMNSTTNTKGSGSKSKAGGTKSGTGSKSKGGGTKSGTGSQSKAGGTKSGTGSQSKAAGSNSGTGSQSKAAGSGSQSGTGSQTQTGTQSQSKQEGIDPPIIGTIPYPPLPKLP